MTTALVRCSASVIMPMQSSSVRNPKTPSVRVVLSAHSPAIGGKNERLPVARISASYRVTEPSSPCTSRANGSRRTTRTPARRSMLLSRYQSIGLR